MLEIYSRAEEPGDGGFTGSTVHLNTIAQQRALRGNRGFVSEVDLRARVSGIGEGQDKETVFPPIVEMGEFVVE